MLIRRKDHVINHRHRRVVPPFLRFTHALDNYVRLSFLMFNDDALRKFQDQLIENDCDQAPIENFAREWFERFTTGVQGHNEPDVKRLSKGLANCRRNNAWKVVLCENFFSRDSARDRSGGEKVVLMDIFHDLAPPPQATPHSHDPRSPAPPRTRIFCCLERFSRAPATTSVTSRGR